MSDFNEAYPGVGLPPTTPNAPQEPVFRVGDQEVPLSKVPPETIKQWYEAEVNRSKWQQSNTQKAQELAAERERWSGLGEYDAVSKKMSQYDQLLDYFQKNPQLEDYMIRHMQANPIGSQQQAGPVNQLDPGVAQVIQELRSTNKELTDRLTRLEETGEQKSLREEQESAIRHIKEKYPDINIEEFQKFVDEQTEKAGNTQQLYEMMVWAKNGSNLDQVRQEAQKETLANIQSRENQVVEPGEKAPVVDLPKNTDISQTDMDEVFENIKEQLGVADEGSPILE